MVRNANVLVNQIDDLKEKQEVFGECITKLDDYKKKLIVKSYINDFKNEVVVPPKSEFDASKTNPDGTIKRNINEEVRNIFKDKYETSWQDLKVQEELRKKA